MQPSVARKYDVDITVNDDGFQIEGSFGPQIYPTILFTLYDEQHTGLLSVNSEMNYKIYVSDGHIVFVDGKEERHLLGNILVSESVIAQTELNEALYTAQQQGLKIGEALILMGKIDPHQLSMILEKQIKEKLIHAFKCQNGVFHFRKENSIDVETIYKINPIQIIYDGVCRFFDGDSLMESGFFNSESNVVSKFDSKLIKSKIDNVIYSSPKELKLLDLLGSGQGLKNAMDACNMDRHSMLRFIYFLYLIKIVEVVNN